MSEGFTGSGGVYAEDLQYATPKYAINDGSGRSDLYKDTLCRLFVRVEDSEWGLFQSSIADPHIARPEFLAAIAGNPRLARGYIDFLVGTNQLNFRELISVGQALSGNHVVYTFDQQPIEVPLSGVLLNTKQDDHATNFVRLYLELLRASALARRQKVVSFKVDSYILTGVFTALSLSYEARVENGVPYNASFLVKRLAIVEYTRSWLPSRVGTPFATDLNAVPTDTRISSDRGIVTVTGRLASDLVRDSAPNEREQREVRQTPQVPTTTQAVELGRLQRQVEASSDDVRRLENDMLARNRDIAAAAAASASGAPGGADALRGAMERSQSTLSQLATSRAELAARESRLNAFLESSQLAVVSSSEEPLSPQVAASPSPETTPPRTPQ